MSQRSVSNVGLSVTKYGLPEFVISDLFLQGQTIVQVCCGVDHCVITCESGRVYSFGRNKHNHLGLTDKGEIVAEPTLISVLSFIQVKQVACGRDFTLFLSVDGKLLGCGSNNFVHGVGTNINGPTPLTWPSGEVAIKKVAAGLGHALALTTNNRVMVSGQNLAGQLGLTVITQPNFSYIDNRTFTDISCGAYHSAVITTDGTLYIAGWNGDGQLGLNSVSKSFQLVSLPSHVTAVVCGFEHTMALTTDGTVWAWGSNHCGQLGIGSKVDSLLPKRVLGLEGQTIKKLVAGRLFTAFITEEGDVLLCGREEGGEQGEEDWDFKVATLVGKSPDLIGKQVDCALSSSLKLVTPKVKCQGVQDANVVLTQLEKSIMTCLECPICFTTMSAPIHMCTEGHGVCDPCRSRIKECALCRKPFVKTRSATLENLVAEMQLPCKDCSKRMPVGLLENHGDVCPGRLYKCPLQTLCDWSGQPETMWSHASSIHPDQTWNIPHIFVHTDFNGLVETNIFIAYREVFLLYRKYDKQAKVFQAAVQIVGPMKKANNLKFSLEIIAGDGGTNLTFHKNIGFDIESTEDVFKSDNSASVKKELLDIFLQGDKLVCEVNVLETECCNRADVVKTLLSTSDAHVGS